MSKQPSEALAKKFHAALEAINAGEPRKAERLLRSILDRVPHQFEALMVLGTIYGQQSRFKEAAAAFERAARNRPDNADALFNLGLAHSQLGMIDRAIDSYRKTLALAPGHLEALNNLGAALIASSRWDDALTCLHQALPHHPRDGRLLNNLAFAQLESGDAQGAVETFTRALAVSSSNSEIHTNLGLAYKKIGQPTQAIAQFRNALAIDNTLAPTHNLLGNTLIDIGAVNQGIESLRRAIQLDPTSAEYRQNLGMCLLLNGEFDEGWREYRHQDDYWRLKGNRPAIDAPHWSGEAVAGKSIIVYSEQGLGDTIQFFRYVLMLAETGARVTFEVQPALIPLLRPSVTSFDIVSAYDGKSRFDFQCSLMGLPRWLDTHLSCTRHRTPYLFADDNLVARWRHRLGGEGYKIGICWQGNPAQLTDKVRSIALRQFAPLAEIEGVRLISLQKAHGTEQVAEVPFRDRIETLGDDFDTASGAYRDTCAVISNLDLVVTCDTSIGHVAGALAHPVFIALCHVPDWRWGLSGESCVWYPTARLFRQETGGDWTGVLARIADAVRARSDNA